MTPFWCACCTASQISRDELEPLAQVRGLRCARTRRAAAADELHREVRLRADAGVRDAGLVDLRDAGVLQAAEDLRLVLEAPQHRGRGTTPGRITLSATRRRGSLLLGLVDGAHAALADEREDAVRADARRVGCRRNRRVLRGTVGVLSGSVPRITGHETSANYGGRERHVKVNAGASTSAAAIMGMRPPGATTKFRRMNRLAQELCPCGARFSNV